MSDCEMRQVNLLQPNVEQNAVTTGTRTYDEIHQSKKRAKLSEKKKNAPTPVAKAPLKSQL